MELADIESFERLTGLAFFTSAGQTSAVPFGNIEMLRCEFGLKSFDILRSRRGQVYPRKRHFYGRTPIFSLQCNQFATQAQALFLAATRLPDVAQVATAGAQYVFTAAPGGAWSLDRSDVFLTSVKVSGQVKVEGYDYFFDRHNGWISLPLDSGTIVAGDTVVVAFAYPAITWEAYDGLATPSVDGVLTVFAEDEFGPPAREQWVMSVTLSCKGMADTEPSKFRSATLEALIYGNPQIYKRPQARGWSELITDTGSVIDLS